VEATIVYVSPSGQDTPPCNLASPCQTPEFGWGLLNATRSTMFLFAGGYVVNSELTVDSNRSIVGPTTGSATLKT
jgi:hypothetical protein